MLPAMAKSTRIAIVGPGRLGSALAIALKKAGYSVVEIVAREHPDSLRRARRLARQVGAKVISGSRLPLNADLIWFCVPDREIAPAAQTLDIGTSWKGRTAFHSSGALGSDELNALRKAGAAVAAVHPFMTFVSRSKPQLEKVPFGIEGDPAAVRLARSVVGKLGGEAFSIRKENKVAYHAWGGFTSPLLVSLLVTGERVAEAAGFSRAQARRWALPILRQTLANYAKLGPGESFSGPIVRGDASVVEKHLRVLQKVPEAHEAYVALVRSALRNLPVQNRRELERALRKSVPRAK
jgi:predicted short-subunit dehydrogenase-like oxidoreductase (DUF2520 family)